MAQSDLVLISGKRCSGKDTVAAIISEKKSSQVHPLASVLKSELAEMINPADAAAITARLMSDRDFKEEYREQLIALGALRRAANPDYFVDKAIEAALASKEEIFIIPDVRLRGELDAIFRSAPLAAKFRIIYIRVEADQDARCARGLVPSEVDSGATETELDGHRPSECESFLLDNSGDLSALRWALNVIFWQKKGAECSPKTSSRFVAGWGSRLILTKVNVSE